MIEVFNVNPINKGDTVASVSVHIKPWKLKIHDIMVMQKGVQKWINLPQRRYEIKGETKYAKQIEFDDSATEKRFRDQIVKAVEEYEEYHGGLEPEAVIKDDQEFPF